jgi:hypothetical protein
MPGAALGVDQWRRHHDVSILIAAGGVGRCLGSQPRAKVSMMIVRPPQHGHGRGSTRDSFLPVKFPFLPMQNCFISALGPL